MFDREFTGGAIAKISRPNIPPFYLVSLGGMTPKDSDTDTQIRQNLEMELHLLKIKAAAAFKNQEGKTVEETIGLVQELNNSSTIGFAIWLDGEDMQRAIAVQQELQQIQANQGTAQITAILRRRYAHHIELAEDYPPNGDILRIKQPWWAGKTDEPSRYRFGDILFTVVSSEPSNNLIRVHPIPVAIAKGDVGFALNNAGGYRMGRPEWTDELTTEFISQFPSVGSEWSQVIEFINGEYLARSDKEEDDKETPLASWSSDRPNSTDGSASSSTTVENITPMTGIDFIPDLTSLDVETAVLPTGKTSKKLQPA